SPCCTYSGFSSGGRSCSVVFASLSSSRSVEQSDEQLDPQELGDKSGLVVPIKFISRCIALSCYMHLIKTCSSVYEVNSFSKTLLSRCCGLTYTALLRVLAR